MLEDEKRWMEIEEIEKELEKIEVFELKKKEEEKEEKAEKIQEEADEELEEKDYEMTTTPPKVSTWIDGVDGSISEGVVVIKVDDDVDVADADKNTVCPICYESVADNGKHRICCLPCGHIYGFSCINQWLRQPDTVSKGCPQCNKLCTFKDIKRLYSSQLSVPAQTLRKASSTTYYPFTLQGYKAYRRHVSQLRTDVIRLFDDVEIRRLHAYARLTDITARLRNIYSRVSDFHALVASVGDRDDALGRHVIALGCRVNLLQPIIDALEPRGDAFEHLADAMEQRVEALVRRDRAYRENILFFRDTYRKLTDSGQNNNHVPKTRNSFPKANSND